MQTPREVNPRAFLSRIKNTSRGIKVRSAIIKMLMERKAMSTIQIAEEIGLSPSAVRRHLKNMSAEGIVKSLKGRGKSLWTLTGLGQQAIDET
ncbi:MAG: ArsR family transcriptional regulator [Thaumarchaeota archaeon]|jgi:predicted ArsR family transcriptional regulator|nr:ArsR family transcriptional regulator [Candidatus Terraquivivens yellowstonensis]MCL7398124.1 ArsR family transcriptional regulator [Candidatus Terraquivivens yellowstonensis]MCL7400873.1 ArsR family transcriptional regulator [Candidatus Terraquivivens yellowstonensis]